MIKLCDECNSPMHLESDGYRCSYCGEEDETKFTVKEDEINAVLYLQVLREDIQRESYLRSKNRGV